MFTSAGSFTTENLACAQEFADFVVLVSFHPLYNTFITCNKTFINICSVTQDTFMKAFKKQ